MISLICQNFYGKGKEALWVKIRKTPCFLQVVLVHVNLCHHIQEALLEISSHQDVNDRL